MKYSKSRQIVSPHPFGVGKIKTVLVLSLALFLSGCGEKHSLSFVVVTPEEDPFEGVTQMILRIGNKEKTETVSDSGSISMSLNVAYGERVQLELIGLDAEGDVLCSGKSPLFYAVGSKQKLRLWVSRAGELSLHPEQLEQAAGRMSFADYLLESHGGVDGNLLLYSFWFGGCDSMGLPVDTTGFFDPYLQETVALPRMEDSGSWIDPMAPVEPRCESAVMGVESGYFLIYGGVDSDGYATDTMYLVVPRADDYKYMELNMGNNDNGEDWTRSGSQTVTFGPYPGLYTEGYHRIVNNFLITGGRNSLSSRSQTALHVVSKLSSHAWDYMFEMESVELLEPRGSSHTATVTVSRENDVEVRTVLLFGGTEDATGVYMAETLRYAIDWAQPDWNWSWIQKGYDLDEGGEILPAVTGHAAVTLTDGAILVAGGKRSDGVRLADAWLFDPRGDTITRLPDFLDEPRAGHTMTRTGNIVLIAGGEKGDGVLAEDALLVTDDRLNGILEQTGRVRMNVPRWGHGAIILGNGEIALLGGFDHGAGPLKSIEIFNPRF